MRRALELGLLGLATTCLASTSCARGAGARAGPVVGNPEAASAQARPASLPDRVARPSFEERRRRDRDRRRVARLERLATQPTVSGDFVGQDLREVLASVAAETKTRIVLYSGGQSTVDLSLIDTPLETALDLLLFPIDYVFARRGEGTYVCGPADPALPIFREIAVSRIVRTNSDPEELRSLLPEKSFQPFVRASKQRRSLTITAPSDLAERIQDLVEELDQPRAQVVIEVLVTSVERSAGALLGNKHDPLAYALGFKGEGKKDADVSFSDGVSYVLSWSAGLLGSIEFLESNGLAEVRARPRVVATEGEVAEIQAIQEYYVPIAGNLVTNPEIEIIQAGVRMKVTPIILASGAVELAIEPEVADVIGLDPNNALPIISRRSVKTTVQVGDGESLVIGGLYESVRRDDRTNTPVLGRIPFLMPLFASKDATCRELELVLVITPRILSR